MSAISKRTDALTPGQKRALLAQLLQKTASQFNSFLPLSSGQQSLWFLYKLAPQSWAYNVLFSGRICSPIDIPALRGAFGALIERHPVLRTTYTVRDAKPVQQVHEYSRVHFEEIDASAWSQDELNNRLVEAAHRPFALERGPVLRVNLFTQRSAGGSSGGAPVQAQSATEHILLLTVHHIAVDFWSLIVLLDELRVLYPAQKKARKALSGAGGDREKTFPLSLPPLEKQYPDYVRWQAEMLASAEGERLWAYWQRQLAGELPVLNLPTDRPRPPVQTYRGASVAFNLSQELTQQLKALAKNKEATPYMTLLAAFQVLLYRYTNQEDILVGSPTTGRSRREFSGIVGDFINPVVLRADLSGNPTFETFLIQVRHTVLAALKHQNYPFALLVERLHLTQEPSRSPLFQVMFILQKLHRFEDLSEFVMPNATKVRMDFGGLELEPLVLAQQEGQFDLTLEMIETGGVLKGSLKYNPDLFEANTAEQMVKHFQTLLSSIVANPDQPIATLPILTAPERQTLLVEWNDTQLDDPKELCLHQLFEAQVRRTPEAIAAVFADKSLTYQELNVRANQLAHYLQTLGVGPEVLVGICVERSLEMIVGLLGILKAGGAYVPLDPAYPQARLAFMLEDAQVSVLLTQQRLVAALPVGTIVCLDLEWQRGTANCFSQENPVSNVTAENLAYVIYTSGSTGKPKGVQIPHRAVVNLLHSMQKQPGLTHQDILLAVTSISFDIAALEIFLPLLVGAKVVLVSREVATSGPQLLAKLLDSGATVLQATPATWRLLLAAGWQGSVRFKALCGGESLERELANQLLERSATLWNLYGPTETTIWSAAYRVKPKGDAMFIGRPIANTQLYILDTELQPTPIGVPGELYIGGVGLARGYLNHPELTAQKFIPNPYSEELGARLYKTGDLACYLPDGNIKFLSRTDHQVKIRGFRIELEEIEAAISQHSSIRQSVVMIREDLPGDKRLVAYIVPYQEQATTPHELRRFLQQQLPNYMLPSVIVTLPVLPLTPNGKVDRRALPVPDQVRLEPEETFVLPQDPVELQLTKIWEQVLGIQPISVRDNFFDLGGHSLLAVQLFAQIKQVFGKDLPLVTLFQVATIEQLAHFLRQSGGSDWSSLVAIQPRGSKPPLFCVHAVGASILSYRNLAPYLGPEQPVYGLQALGLDGKQAPLTRIEDMAAHYIKEIQTLQPQGPYFLAGHSFGGTVAFEIAQQLHNQGEKVNLLALFDTLSPALFQKNPPPFFYQLYMHGFNLSRLQPKQQQAYIRERVQLAIERLIKKITDKFYLWTGRPLPDELPENYQLIEAADCEAFRNYVPQVYPGRVTLFRAIERPTKFYYQPQLGWGELAADGLELQEVPGHHMTMILEPRVRVLAEKLRSCLDAAQADG